MRTSIKKVISLILVFTLLFSMSYSAFAAAAENLSNVSVVFKSDKKQYKSGEEIKLRTSIKNPIEEKQYVSISYQATPLVKIDAAQKNSIKYEKLESGESKEFNTTAKANHYKFNAEWLQKLYDALFGAFWSAVYMIRAMFNNALEVVSIKVDGIPAVILAQVDACLTLPEEKPTEPEEPTEPTEPTDPTDPINPENLTKEGWIYKLSDLVSLEKLEFDNLSFDDSDKTKKPEIVESAIRMGIIDVKPDEDNMVYFNPTDAATREYIAYTSVRALNYQMIENELPTWPDKDELSYPLEDKKAVDLGIVVLQNNKFVPAQAITNADYQNAITAITRIIYSTNVSSEPHGEVNYAEGVQETTLEYILNEAEKTVIINNTNTVANWKSGEIHVLKSIDGSQKDIAVKILSISQNNGKTIIKYETPELHEVIDSFNVEGKVTEGCTFIPAAGVNITPVNATKKTRSKGASKNATNNTIPLFQEFSLTYDFDEECSVSGKMTFESIDYCFDANATVLPPFISINRIYLALNCSTDFNVSFAKKLPDEKSKHKLGDIPVPVGWGFNGSIEVYFVVTVEGKIEIGFSLDTKTGIQYTKNGGLRGIRESDFDVDENPSLNATFSAGLNFKADFEFLGIDLVGCGPTIGGQFDGSLEGISDHPLQFCLDGTLFMFLKISANIGPEALHLSADWDIFNSNVSPVRKNWHFEETGRVEECTRGKGKYEGSVRRADDNVAVSGAKVQLYRGNRLIETLYTGPDGKFGGSTVKSGTYTLRVSARGYIPYEKKVDVVGGNTTVIETQLLISRDNVQDDAPYRCSGNIKNAFTGSTIEGATIVVNSVFLFGSSEPVATVVSDSNGNYSFKVKTGIYELTVSKDNFVTSSTYITVIKSDISNINLSLSPTNQSTVVDNLRVKLRWGATPSDLDSHMVGPNGNGKFHVYYRQMSSGKTNLDTDDTTSYGPETISITEMENGVYSYYIHDYTNRSSNNSYALSNSGAFLELISANKVVHTIHIPADQEGTLWHAFDYNSETGEITLVNEFSYHNDPSTVGM